MKKWLTLVLCLFPFLAVALWFIAGQNLGNLATIGLVLACPLSHLFLMKGHDHNDKKRKQKGGEQS